MGGFKRGEKVKARQCFIQINGQDWKDCHGALSLTSAKELLNSFAQNLVV
jgi:hypothetical protein